MTYSKELAIYMGNGDNSRKTAIAIAKSVPAILSIAAVAAGTMIWHVAKGAVHGAADG